jgi:hypothetical protein
LEIKWPQLPHLETIDTFLLPEDTAAFHEKKAAIRDAKTMGSAGTG